MNIKIVVLFIDFFRFSLRRRPSSATSSWMTVAETGPKGGTLPIIVSLQQGEEVAVFLDSGESHTTRSQTFSGYKIGTP